KWMMENWRGAYDLKALGEIGDFVKVMSYGQHTRRTTPGPSQGLPWLEQVVQYFLQIVPAEKLNLGLTMSGSRYFTVADTARYYQNGRSWSSGVSVPEAASLLEQYGGEPLTWDDRQRSCSDTSNAAGSTSGFSSTTTCEAWRQSWIWCASTTSAGSTAGSAEGKWRAPGR
ncbi:MAG TPA: hypothetical protein VMO47_16520, partial [Rhodothermales bacterium]|nr:hypothetical protein [Rhodothermales bacterium]